MPTATRFSLARALERIGVRGGKTVPEVNPSGVTLTVSVGELETFAPQVHVARGLYYATLRSGSGFGFNTQAVLLQSLAPGGLVVEQVAGEPMDQDERVVIQRSEDEPVSGLTAASSSTIMSIGGLDLTSIIYDGPAFAGLPPFPPGQGSRVDFIAAAGTPHFDPRVVAGIWVPPSWWLMVALSSDADRQWGMCLRWREIPEALVGG